MWWHRLMAISALITASNSLNTDEIEVTYENISRQFNYPNIEYYNTNQVILDKSFDFIIIGAGNAGSVIANRLSENPNWNILLLEAGDEPTILTEVPTLAPLFQFTKLTSNYLMEKQDNLCMGMIDQRMTWPRGRVLGGTSLINYMIHIRGNPKDYNRWAKLGNPGWAYKDVLKYFLKSEDAHLTNPDPGYHARGGYLGVQHVPYRSKSVDAFVQAAQEAGHESVDYNGRKQLGVSYVQATLRDGRRCSAERAFLRPVRNRKNLRILTGSQVVKILIDPQTKTAYGVQYYTSKSNQYHTVTATKEVILSAGALISPQLLMLSGIGPKSHLDELGINLVKDLPVGQKMYDHITFAGLIFTLNESIVLEQKLLEEPNSFVQLIFNGSGPLTNLAGVEGLVYVKSNLTKKSYPDVELIFISGGFQTDSGKYYRKTFRITDEIYNAVWKPLENKAVWTVFPMPLHPKSTGYIRLKSTNPFHWPKFYGNYLTDPDHLDIRTFIAGIRAAQKISNMPSLQRFNSTIVSTPIPGCQHLPFDSDLYWECALRHISPTLNHHVATCKMGPANDREAVVDHRLRVHGVKNLRVADAGIIPITISAHSSVPTFMIGEKASDLIKEDWLL